MSLFIALKLQASTQPYIPSTMDQPRFYAGNLLLALPGIGDANFEHAAIAMCAHDPDGALGIDIGQELEGITLHGLLRQLSLDTSKVGDRPVLRGGPVEPSRGFVLHSLDWAGQDMLHVAAPDGAGWGLSGSLDILRAIADGKGPSRYLVALGYAGWGAGQLDQEMTRHGWFLGSVTDSLLFDTPANLRWNAAFAASGIDSALLAARSGTA